MNRLNEREIIDLFISKFRKISKIEKDDIVNLPIKVNNITIKLILKCDMLVESYRCTCRNATLANCKKKYRIMH